MTLSNLRVGQTYKNYKDLCAALDEPVKSSDSKIAQLKTWDKYFKFERIGRSYNILEIYEIPISIQSKVTLFSEAMYPIIIYYLYQNSLEHKGTRASFPALLENKYTFFELFRYSNVFYQPPTLPHKSDYLIWHDINDYWYNLINYPFTHALDLLMKDNKIQYQNRYYVYYSGISQKQLASNAHTKIIESNIDLVLEEMNLKSLYEVYRKGKDGEFFDKVNSYLAQYGYVYGSKVLEITLFQSKKHDLLSIEKRYGIKAKYIKMFGDKSEKEIEHIIADYKKRINELILEKAQVKIEEAIENFSISLSSPIIHDTMYEALKADYEKHKLTPEKFIAIYRARLERITEMVFKVS